MMGLLLKAWGKSAGLSCSDTNLPISRPSKQPQAPESRIAESFIPTPPCFLSVSYT
jgi:hypothetical protein